MERKLQAIRSAVKEVGFELVVGFLVLGARAGGAVIGFGVGGAAVRSAVLGAAVVGTVVGGGKEELLATDCGRMTSTTNTAIAPARPNKILPKEIHRYTGRWYHFVPSGTALGS